MKADVLLWSLPSIGVVGGALAWLAGGSPTRPEKARAARAGAVGILALLATLAAAVAAALDRPAASWVWVPGVTLRLATPDAAALVAPTVAAVAAAVVAYAAAHHDRDRPRLIALLVVFVGAMELLVVADDLVTLLIAWELVGALSWALIGHRWRDRTRTGAAVQAFVVTHAGDLGLVVAAGTTFAGAGRVDLDALGTLRPGALGVVTAGVVVAAITKSAQLPFSPWLFAAMEGPTPVSALLHSATMVAAGAYLLARLQPVLATVGWFGPATLAIGIATAVAGGIVAAGQPEIKRLLAGSTAAHHGLMLVALGAGYPAVALAHLAVHAVAKALLFLTGGAAIAASGTERLDRQHLRHQLPLTATLALAGALALAGIPPTGLAWTKERIVGGATEHGLLLGLGAAVAGALSAFYALRLQLLAFGSDRSRPGRSDLERLRGTVAEALAERRRSSAGVPAAGSPARPSRPETAATAVLAAATAATVALWWPAVPTAVGSLLGAFPALGAGETAVSLGLVALGAGAAILLHRRNQLAAVAGVPGLGWAARTWFGLPALCRAAVVDPVLALARTLAAADDGVARGVVGVAAASAGAGSAAVRTVDARVLTSAARLVAGSADRAAGVLGTADTRAVEAVQRGAARAGEAVAGLLASTGEREAWALPGGLAGTALAGGRAARRLQSGLVHRYYLLVTGGLVLAAAVAVVWSR